MPTLVFIQPGGLRREIEATVGITLMEAARQNNVPGVVAQCGGACACATCHVYIERSRLQQLEQPLKIEGVAVTEHAGVIQLLLVTDADDASVPASLYGVTLAR